MRHVATLMLIVGLCCGVTVAQTIPDFQSIMDNLPQDLNRMGGGAGPTGPWTDTFPTLAGAGTGPTYAHVVKQGEYWHEDGNFSGKNNYSYKNVIPDDSHLVLLQKVLEGDACVREIIGDGTVDAVRAAFFQNQANVTNFETNFDAELLKDHTRIDVLNIPVFGDVSNRPAWSNRFTVYTGTHKNDPVATTIKITVDSGKTIIGTTDLTEKVTVPSLWGADGLIAEIKPGLENDIRDLLAAYLTIGEQQGVDYMQGILFEMFYCGVFPNIADMIAGMLKNIDTSPVDDDFVPWVPEPPLSNKAYGSSHPIENLETFKAFDPHFVVPGSIEIRLRSVQARVYGTTGTWNMQTGLLQHWLHKYTVGQNGFHAGFAHLFSGQGDLDGNGQDNNDAWGDAQGDTAQFLVNAGTGVLFDWEYGLQAPATPLNWGTYHNMMVQTKGGTGNPVTYQWYTGPTVAELAAIPGATGKTYQAQIDFYSFGAQTQSRVYRVVATTEGCGDTINTTSTIVIQGGEPPAINFNAHPVSQNATSGAKVELGVNILVGAGTPSYQWQKFDDDLGWDNIEGATAATLVFNSVSTDDAGEYRCRVFNVIDGNKSDKANPEYFADSNPAILNVAPPISIDVQPVGAGLDIGEDYQLYVEASVADGNLEYRWYRNPGTGFAALGDWVDAGDTSFVATFDINNAQLSDSGQYRLSVRNTLAPFGTYQLNSATANVNVSSGVVFYVDPTGDDSDGLTWETAFNTLQVAIDEAASSPLGGEVWVAGGPVGAPIVYGEARTEPWGDYASEGSLVMKDNVALYGGFEGYRGGDGAQEENRLFRNRAQNTSVIDGSASNNGAPAFHVVVFGKKLSATVGATLDGFVITGGNASGVPGDYHTHRGGGIYNYGSAPAISNCMIVGNDANTSGGGISNEYNNDSLLGGDATITNCVIANNTAARQADGMPGPDGGTPIRGGGAIFNAKSSPTLNFLTIVDNVVDNTYALAPGEFGVPTDGRDSGGILNWDGSGLLSNSIVYNNTGAINTGGELEAGIDKITVVYSDVEGGFDGPGNIDVDPLLGNADYTALLGADVGAYVPDEASPIVDAADPNVGGDDLLGVPRPIYAAADMGAFELSLTAPAINCIASDPIDFIETPQLDDPFVLADLDNAVFEAPFWKLYLEDKVFGCADIPLSGITVTAVDILGREGSCVADVPVTESEDPVAVCNAIEVELDASGFYALNQDDIDALSAGSYDNCSDAVNLDVSVTPSSFTCDDAGRTVNVSVTVTDEEGNADTCTAQVTVNDSIAPEAAVGNVISVDLNAFGQYTLSSADRDALKANATDNCAVDFASSTVDASAFTCADLGDNEVDVTWYDFAGNSVDGTATVTVNDVHAPALQNVIDRTYSIATGDFTEAQALAGVTALDVCDGDVTASITVEVFDQDDNPVAFPVPTSWPMEEGQTDYLFTLRYTVADNSTNEVSEEAVLTFNALRLPEITVIGEERIHECHTVYYFDEDEGATAYDPQNDNDITMELVVDHSDVDQNTVGIYHVVFSVPVPGYPDMDPVTAIREVHVIDTIAPTLVLNGSADVVSELGNAYVEPGFTASDSCEGNLNNDVVVTGAIDINTPGVYTLEYNVSDPSGNAAVAQFRNVIVAEEVTITGHPSDARVYTSDAPFVLEASYTGGFDLNGHEWFRDGVGLGMEAPETGGNTVTLTVDPAALGAGVYTYRMDVTDFDILTYSTDNAEVEVGQPLTADVGLTDLALQDGEEGAWSIQVSGGLGTVHYQWYASFGAGKSFTPVVDGPLGDGAYAGADTNTLNLVPFSAEMVGQYQVEVTDDFSSLTVGPASLILDYGIPAASAIGIAVLALATALGGARALRKRD